MAIGARARPVPSNQEIVTNRQNSENVRCVELLTPQNVDKSSPKMALRKIVHVFVYSCRVPSSTLLIPSRAHAATHTPPDGERYVTSHVPLFSSSCL